MSDDLKERILPAMAWGTAAAERLLSAHLALAADDDLRAVAAAWLAADEGWRRQIFTPAADDAMNFWGHFSGKADHGDLLGLWPDLTDRLGREVVASLRAYANDLVDAMWVGADPQQLPDPWAATGREPLHAALAEALERD